MKKTIAIAAVIASSFALAFVVAQTGGAGFRAIKLPGDGERVTGVYCTAVKACVVSTNAPGGGGHLYATDGQKITDTLLTGNSKLAESLGTIGEINFAGFSHVGDRLIALVEGAGASFVSATGDITKAASWSAVKIGSLSGDGTFGLNQQMGFGKKDDRWVHFVLRSIFETNDAPGPGALWTRLWSPVSPSVPSNFDALKRAEPKLCDSDPGVTISPRLTQPAYVAPDLAIVLYPAGARNQRGTDSPGVCISTDGGKRFYHVEFKGIEEDYGPLGVSCLSANQCWAYGGLDNAPESAYISITKDAQKGVTSTWTKARLPNLREDTKFRSLAFAPDGMNGFAVGSSGSSDALMFTSSDGGLSWKDATGPIRALTSGARLHTAYAFNAAHVWIGGEGSTLLTTGN